MHNILKMNGLGESATWEIVGSTSSLEKVFTDASLLLQQSGLINIHYTCHHVLPSAQRDFSSGEWVFFDFDKIQNYSKDLVPKFIDALVLVAGLSRESIWAVSSGNGVHLLVKVPVYSIEYLSAHKSTYSKMSDQIVKSLAQRGINCEADPIFQRAKSLRLPGTINRKPDKPDSKCELIQKATESAPDFLTSYRLSYDRDFSLSKEIEILDLLRKNAEKKSLLPSIIQNSGQSISGVASKEDILTKCSFTANLKKDLAYLPREQWLRAVGFLTTLNLEAEAHEWSELSPSYKQSETQEIIDSAKQKGLHPTSCAKIKETYNAELTAGCDTCVYKSCGTPAKLFSDETLLSLSQGFYTYYEKAGEMVRGKINYTELVNFCHKYLNIVSLKEHGKVYGWNNDENIHEEQDKHSMAKIFHELVNPKPLDTTEFLEKGINNMKIHHSRSEKHFLPPDGFIPLQNGWLNAVTGDLEQYSPKWLVTQKIPVSYDPLAKCPNFEKFLDERIGDKDTIAVLLQYICYALAGVKFPNRKILVLEGPPGTGKTTLANTFSKLFGHLYTMAQLQHLSGRFETAIFENKRMVYFDEAPQERDSVLIEVLKNLSGAPEIRIEKKNENAITVQNLGRIVISCNEIPRGGAMDQGFMDRLLIVPMHNQIEVQSNETVDQITAELPGILNLVLAQFKTLREQSFQIHPTELTRKQANNYQLENDPIALFVEEEITLVPVPDLSPTYIKENCFMGTDMNCMTLKNFKSVFSEWAREEMPYYVGMPAVQIRKRLETLMKTLYRDKNANKFQRPTIYKSAQGIVYLVGLTFKNKSNYLRKDAGDRF